MRTLLVFCFIVQALAFAPVPLSALQSQIGKEHGASFLPASKLTPVSPMDCTMAPAGLGFVSGSLLVIQGAWAVEEIEMADLPPPYVPVLFGLGVLVGVGILTSSLGDVIDEEASLGMQSGARAKKEIERSRSSYFKKK